MESSACCPSKTSREPDMSHLFEDCAWLYAFFRERLFHDHTDEIAQALFPAGVSSENISVLEVGCGPGFYARRLAQRYPALRVLGLDRSLRLIALAREKACTAALVNCQFQQGNVESLSSCVEAVDAVISSRLLLVVDDREALISEIFRVLKPGGRLFLAEPTATFKTRLPLSVMRLASRMMRSTRHRFIQQTAEVLTPREFEDIVHSQPWSKASIRMYGDYQCAICEKSGHAFIDAGNAETSRRSIPVPSLRSFA